MPCTALHRAGTLGAMNYLAHIYLAQHDDEAMVGALLGDFVGSDKLDHYSPTLQAEIRLHRKIDRYTDSHPAVLAAKQCFPDGRRRYAGILLDVYYDHLLARQWSRYSDTPLDQFNQRFYAALQSRQDQWPKRLGEIAPHMMAHDWLGAYRQRESVDHAIRRIATRLSRNGERLVDCLGDLQSHEVALARGFDVFFPELIGYVQAERQGQ